MSKFFGAFKQYIAKHSKVGAYKPTSEKYDAEQMKAVLMKLPKDVVLGMESDDLMRFRDFIEVSNLLNSLYKDFYSHLQNILADLNMTGIDIVDYFIGFLNKEYMTIESKISELPKQLGGGSYLYQDMHNPKLHMSNGAKLDLKAVMEGSTESVSVLCNYMRYHLDEEYKNENADPKWFTSNLVAAFRLANEYATFKHSYDQVIYEQDYVKIAGRTICFEYENDRDGKLMALGHMIIDERVLHVNCQLREKGGKSILSRFVTNYRVKRLKINDGVVTMEFGQGDPKKHQAIASVTMAAILAYYEFLDINMKLEGLGCITLAEVLGVWGALQYICLECVQGAKITDRVFYTKEDMGEFPRKFRAEDLIVYLTKLTGVKENRVKKVLDAFEVDWKGYNDIWTLPLYKIKGYYCLPFYPIVNSMPYNLIENLMQRGGYDLEDRGKDFEQYVYKLLSEAKPQYPIVCKAACKYKKGPDDKGEEIDLVVALRDIVVVAEAKCIHYSMEPQNYYDAWNRLKGGAEQAKRKADFMREHPETFTDLGDVRNKKIIPVVLTNYPMYAGFEHEGVYVIDSHTFASYFAAGYMTKREMGKDSNDIVDAKFFYNSETEFSANFENYLKDQPVKKIHMAKMVIDEIPLLPRLAHGKCIAKSAVYKGLPGFDLSAGVNLHPDGSWTSQAVKPSGKRPKT